MARSSYIVNPPNTKGGGVATESHDHSSLYYTQIQADARFVNGSGDTLNGPLSWDMEDPADTIVAGGLVSDTYSRIVIGADGEITFGSGSAAGDSTLRRLDTTSLITNSSLTIEGSLSVSGSITRDGNAIWDSSNHGAGSGLDADMLDGQHGSYYAPLTHDHDYTPIEHDHDISEISDFNEMTIDLVADALGANEPQVGYGIYVDYDDTQGRINLTYNPPNQVWDHNMITDWSQAVHNSAGEMFVGNSTNGINVTYDPFSQKINFEVPQIFIPSPHVDSHSDTGTLDLDVTDGNLSGTVLDSPLLDGNNGAHYLNRDNHTGPNDADTLEGFASDHFAISTHDHGDFLSLSGGTLTGTLTLQDDPSGPLEAATKQYVDSTTGSFAEPEHIVGFSHFGSNAEALRPDVPGVVMWFGSVRPLNREPGDIWFPTDAVVSEY